ncbi:MFS transporter [Limosilactobacillus avium]|uniref:MFS transporter n=1 Tax=Limosilactobacillus avium TaxID=2991831 RepID=UPI0024B91E0A|nr:MFS transporter [Limosilactobacillus avium]
MERKRFGIVLPLVLISYFMILLDNSVVFTSTVKISQDLHMSAQALSWVSNAYVLTFGGLQLLGGRLGDLFGRRRVFLTGLAMFTIFSLLVGISVNGQMIIIMRALQGIGSAILAPTTLALLMDNYEGEMLQRGIDYYGTTAGLGASFGMLIGGLIASFTSWRVGFLMNVPIGIVIFILTLRYVKERGSKDKQPLDILGGLFSVLGIAGIIYSINGSIYKLPSLILGIIFLILFVIQEKRAATPIMPLKLFKSLIRDSAYIARFFIIGMAFTFLYLAPQLMQNLYHFTPFLASIAFLLMSVPQFIMASRVGQLAQRTSIAKVAVLSSAISVVAILWIVVIGVQRGFWLSLVVPLILIGVGQGFAMSPLTSLGVSNTTPDIAGSTSGVVNTFHQTGQSIGLAITIALTGSINSYAKSFNMAMVVLLVYTVVALLATTNIVRLQKK